MPYASQRRSRSSAMVDGPVYRPGIAVLVHGEAQRTSVAQRPRHLKRLRVGTEARAACDDLREQRHDALSAHGQQLATERQPRCMRLAIEGIPIEPALRPRRFLSWVRDVPFRLRNLRASSVAYGLREIAAEIREKQEGCAGAEFLAHEQERDRRGEQEHGQEAAQLRSRRKRVKPLAEGAIADLIVVLQEVDECIGRQMRARLAALETLPETASKQRKRLLAIIGVIAVPLAGQGRVRHG